MKLTLDQNISYNNTCNIIIIIMGLESVSASVTSSGTSLHPGLPSIHNNCGNPGRRGRIRWVHQPDRLFHVSVQVKKSLWRERCVFNEEGNKGKVGQERSGRGREFQMDGVANENERRPFADRILGTVRRNLSRDLKFLVGIQGTMRSDRYEGC